MKKTFQELQDETLIADLGEGGNICDISIDKLRSPTMKKLHKASCPGKEKDTGIRRAAKRAGLTRAARDKLYNSVEESESRRDALKRALEISKWMRAGGKVQKQPPTPAGGGRGSYGGRGKGVLAPMSKEDEKMAKDLKAYRRKLKKKKKNEDFEEGYKDLPPHLQKLVKKIEKRQKDWNKQNPRAKIKTLVYNPETGKPDIEVEEGYQEIQNLANLIKSETDRLVKAAKKGDMKTVMAIYRTIGNIIK